MEEDVTALEEKVEEKPDDTKVLTIQHDKEDEAKLSQKIRKWMKSQFTRFQIQ